MGGGPGNLGHCPAPFLCPDPALRLFGVRPLKDFARGTSKLVSCPRETGGSGVTKKILIGVLVAVLLLGIGGVSFAALKVAEKGESQDTKAEVQSTSGVVDDKLTEVWEQLKLRDEEWAELENDTDLDPAPLLESAPEHVADIRAMADEARELAGAIPDDEVKAAYISACDELDAALDKVLEEADEAKPFCDAYLLCWNSIDNDVSGWNALQASIDSCNAENYDQGKTQAQEAQVQFEAMKTAYQQAASVSGMAEVAEGVQYAEAQILVCAAQQELARLGGQGSVSGYNAQIDRLNEQEAHAASFEDTAALAVGALWVKMQGHYGNFEDRAIKARALWEDARELAAGK